MNNNNNNNQDNVYGAVIMAELMREFTPGLIPRKNLDCTGGDIYVERGAPAYNEGLGAGDPGAEGQGAKPP